MRFFLQLHAALVFLLLLSWALPLEYSSPGRIFFSSLVLIVTVALPGFNATILLSLLLKRTFSFFEFFSLVTLLALVIPPLLLSLEFQTFKTLSPILSFFNSFLIFIATFTLLSWKKDFRSNPLYYPPQHSPFSIRLFSADVLLLSIFGISAVTAYYALPDLDPYYWLTRARDFFTVDTLPLLNESRPFFLSLVYIFTVSARIDAYAFFKYVLPLFLILLALPSFLLSKHFSHSLQKALIFLFPFVSGIFIIFLLEPIPQGIANIFAFYALVFALHSLKTSDTFFFFITGATLLFGYFYHEAFILPLIAWIIAVFCFYRNTLFGLAKNNPLATLLLFLVFAQYFTHIFIHFTALLKIFANNLAHIQPNLLFPFQYVNVDGNQMGWGDVFGVAKYYLFYVGPALLLLFIGLCFVKRESWQRFLKTPQGLFLTLSFFFFFLIAEVFPRMIGMAFLPDRAWIFGGVFALAFFVLFFETPLGKKGWILALFLIAFSANIGAATYINSLKRYIITREQLQSAEWIKQALPPERTIFTVDNGRLLRFFSSSNVVNVPETDFLFDETAYTHELEVYKKSLIQTDEAYRFIPDIQRIASTLTGENMLHQLPELQLLIQSARQTIDAAPASLPQKGKWYIYYAAPSKKNPYLDRPYMKKLENREEQLLFNRFPDRFRKIYSNEENKIFLWEIL